MNRPSLSSLALICRADLSCASCAINRFSASAPLRPSFWVFLASCGWGEAALWKDGGFADFLGDFQAPQLAINDLSYCIHGLHLYFFYQIDHTMAGPHPYSRQHPEKICWSMSCFKKEKHQKTSVLHLPRPIDSSSVPIPPPDLPAARRGPPAVLLGPAAAPSAWRARNPEDSNCPEGGQRRKNTGDFTMEISVLNMV